MLQLPVTRGVIRRRILVNFRADPTVIQKQLPAPFRPKLLADSAVAGICLIRLEQLRPRFTPVMLGLASENAAHRIAVVWTGDHGETQEGVFIPRRDTSSYVIQLAGGRIFPGEHHAARFDVSETADSIDFSMRSVDGKTEVAIRVRSATQLPSTSRFASLDDASRFFEAGDRGYSPRSHDRQLDGLQLRTDAWKVTPLAVERVNSSYFADESRFPPGSVEFDCALLMRNIPHEWHRLNEIRSVGGPTTA
jgi:hypothetical protein